MSQSKMLTTRRKKQTAKKQLARVAKQAKKLKQGANSAGAGTAKRTPS